MSFLASEWASETAPVADTYERIILMKLASHASDDGRGTYPSVPSMARAALCDTETVKRRLRALQQRGVITAGDQRLVSHIRADKRPKVYDLLIPFGWYSDEQRAKVNQQCVEVGRDLLTSENRPPLVSAPPRKRRADKGVSNPKRSPKKTVASAESGALVEPPTKAVDNSVGGSTRAPDGGSLSRAAGALVEPQISQFETSPKATSQAARAATPSQNELPACLPAEPSVRNIESNPRAPSTAGAQLLRSLRLGTPVTNQVVRQHHQAVTDLLKTWPEAALVTHFQREASGGRVASPMGLLVSVIRSTGPYQRSSMVSAAATRPEWCGTAGEEPCNPDTRMREPLGRSPWRCPDCHPSLTKRGRPPGLLSA